MPHTPSESAYVERTLTLLADLGLPGSWRVQFSPNMGRRLGTCNYAKQLIRLNYRLLAGGTEAEVMDTIYHEVAHAVARDRYGAAIKPHGAEWKKIARELGATPRATVPLREGDAGSRAAGLASSSPKRTRRRNRQPSQQATASFHSTELGRVIRAGDQLTLQGRRFEVVETKRTRFTGINLHNGQIYSIPASLIPQAKFH